jgi:hypothetical protein
MNHLVLSCDQKAPSNILQLKSIRTVFLKNPLFIWVNIDCSIVFLIFPLIPLFLIPVSQFIQLDILLFGRANVREHTFLMVSTITRFSVGYLNLLHILYVIAIDMASGSPPRYRRYILGCSLFIVIFLFSLLKIPLNFGQIEADITGYRDCGQWAHLKYVVTCPGHVFMIDCHKEVSHSRNFLISEGGINRTSFWDPLDCIP